MGKVVAGVNSNLFNGMDLFDGINPSGKYCQHQTKQKFHPYRQ